MTKRLKVLLFQQIACQFCFKTVKIVKVEGAWPGGGVHRGPGGCHAGDSLVVPRDPDRRSVNKTSKDSEMKTMADYGWGMHIWNFDWHVNLVKPVVLLIMVRLLLKRCQRTRGLSTRRSSHNLDVGLARPAVRLQRRSSKQAVGDPPESKPTVTFTEAWPCHELGPIPRCNSRRTKPEFLWFQGYWRYLLSNI